MGIQEIMKTMYGRLRIFAKYNNGKDELLFEDNNAITYRAKAVMSRLLAGGLNPNTSANYTWGNPANPLRVTGIALGNGGHLIYNNATSVTDVLPKITSTIVVDPNLTAYDSTKPAMPLITASPQTWGYDGIQDNPIPGSTYEKVENGNIPYDGSTIQDNAIGVDEPNTTLYSETFRIPLDVDITAGQDGYYFPTHTEVTFKATLPQAYLNNTILWGFASQPANLISEAGLVCGYSPTLATLNSGQIYSLDGQEPWGGVGAGGYDFGAGETNWGPGGAAVPWEAKDQTIATSTNPNGLDKNQSKPPTVVNGVDTFGTNDNTWNIIARKTFPAIPKSSNFSLVFVWSIGF